MALAPRLTALDRRVLAALPAPSEPRARLADVFAEPATRRCLHHGLSHGSGFYNHGCEHCGRELRRLADAFEDFRTVARGLERTGHAEQTGGWWRQA